jgi:hypothetical protein
MKNIKAIFKKISEDMNDFVGDENDGDSYPVTMISEETLKLAEEEVQARVTNEMDGNYGFGGMYEFDDSSEYYIFDSYDEAEQVTVQYVREMMNEPDMFSPSFMNQYINTQKLTKDLWFEEENYFYDMYNEMSDDELIEAVELSDGEYSEDTFDREDAIQELVDKRGEMFDGVEWLEEIYGSNWMSEFKNIEWYINYDEASEDAVNIDGVAHFLAGYDGDQIDLANGGCMFRTN